MLIDCVGSMCVCVCVSCCSGVHFNSQAIAPTIEQIDQSFGATHPGGTFHSTNTHSQINLFSLSDLFGSWSSFLFTPPPFSLQCCRAVVPSQLSRTVLLLPTGLVERSSEIWGENTSTELKDSRVVLSRQLWDWIDQPSYGQAEVEPCVCYEHVLETLSAWCCVMIISKGCGTEWRRQMHVQNEIVLLLGKQTFVFSLGCFWQISKCTKNAYQGCAAEMSKDSFHSYVSSKSLTAVGSLGTWVDSGSRSSWLNSLRQCRHPAAYKSGNLQSACFYIHLIHKRLLPLWGCCVIISQRPPCVVCALQLWMS